MPRESPGVTSIASPYSIESTVSRLEALIKAKGLTLFAHIDHAAGAREAGLQMQEAQILIFGNAKSGTPLMVATPLLALDLPLKILVWQDAEQKVWLSYNTPAYLAQRHTIPADLTNNIAGIEALAKAAVA
jgi:uncharacterized protein (DUF302 family)